MELNIQLIKKELRTDSRLLSQFLDHRHRTILENIDKYITELNSLNKMVFEVEELEKPNPIETESGKTISYMNGKATRYAMLTEDQCYFILTLMRNNPKVVEAKLKLVKAFRDARQQLAKRDIARIDGKVARIAETSAIKELVDYAEANGSSNAEMYYQTITRMTNKLLNIEAGKRNELSADVLDKIAMIETMVKLAIRDGIKAELEYKDIYKLAKYRCEELVKSTLLQIK